MVIFINCDYLLIFMGFVEILRKLGIFRSGAIKSTYKNAKERPIEMQHKGVFDSKKDLIYSNEKRPKKSRNNFFIFYFHNQ